MYVIGDKDSNFIIVSRVSVYSGINVKKTNYHCDIQCTNWKSNSFFKL